MNRLSHCRPRTKFCTSFSRKLHFFCFCGATLFWTPPHTPALKSAFPLSNRRASLERSGNFEGGVGQGICLGQGGWALEKKKDPPKVVSPSREAIVRSSNLQWVQDAPGLSVAKVLRGVLLEPGSGARREHQGVLLVYFGEASGCLAELFRSTCRGLRVKWPNKGAPRSTLLEGH